MSLSAIFNRLGARLANVQWSWGGVRADGAVFLRVWQDETTPVDGRRYVRLVNRGAYQGVDDNLGYNERERHLAALKSGVPGYVLFCRAENSTARPRSIASYDTRDVIRLGKLIEIDGDDWGEMADRVSIKSLLS